MTKPLSRNDLQGSKMLINFCDSAFALGESYQERSLRYLKQIKARNTELLYDGANVCICQVVKRVNKLTMEKIGYGIEQVHLRRPSEEEQSNKNSQIKKMKTGSRNS
jgi:hypothetical protein